MDHSSTAAETQANREPLLPEEWPLERQLEQRETRASGILPRLRMLPSQPGNQPGAFWARPAPS